MTDEANTGRATKDNWGLTNDQSVSVAVLPDVLPEVLPDVLPTSGSGSWALPAAN